MAIKTMEEKESLRKLHQEMMRLAVVIHDSSDAIIIMDMDGKIATWNHGAEKMYGYSVEEALGMNIEEITPSGKLAEQKEYFRRLIAGEAVDSFETSRVAKDGSILDVWLTVTKVLDEPTDSIISTGQEIVKPIGLAMIERNITARKRAEAELREQEGLLANIYENVNEVIFYLDVEADGKYRFRSVNPAFLKVTGLEASQVIGKFVSEVIPEPFLSLVLSNYRKAVQNRERVRWEETTSYPAGNKTGDVTIAPIIDEQGVCTGLIGTVYDIAEHKKTEEALRLSEERFAKAFHSGPTLGTIRSLNDNRILDVNDNFLKVLGYERDDVVGHTPMELGFWAEREVFEKSVQELNQRVEFRDKEVELRTKSGKIIKALFYAFIIEINGEPCALVNFVDITERKQVEEELRESEEKYRNIFNTTGTAAMIVEEDTTISLINREFETLSGYSKEEIEGKKSWKEFFIEDYLDDMIRYHNLRRADPDSAPKQYETAFITRKGDVRQVIVTVSMIPGTKQSISFFLDISGIK